MLYPSLEVGNFLYQLVALIALPCLLSVYRLLLVHVTDTSEMVRVVIARQLVQYRIFNSLSLYFGTHLEEVINEFLEPLHERSKFCFSSQLKMTPHHHVHVITNYLYILLCYLFVYSSAEHVFDIELM